MSGGGEQRIAVATLRAVDLGLAAVIFVGPHLLGGRHPLGRFAIVTMCVVTTVAWFVGQYFNQHVKWRSASGLGILILAIGTVTFQLAPLPDEWLAALAPRISKILPLWHANSAGPQLGEWHTLSLSPEDTRLALATLLAYALLFVTAVQRLDSIDDVKRIIGWISCSALIVATFGIVQYFTANGKFFWFYEYPYTDTLYHLKAGFTCRNHFAHFVVLGLPCLLSGMMVNRTASKPRQQRRDWQFSSKTMENSHAGKLMAGGYIVAIIVGVFAVLASLSRGGVLALVSAFAMLALSFACGGMLRSKHIAAGGGLVVVMMLVLTVSGDYERVTQRLETLSSQDLDRIDLHAGRRLIWSANLAAFQSAWAAGSGAGSHRFIYPLYIERPIASEYTHAESGYLQVATENGLPGVLLMTSAILCCGSWCYTAMRQAGENRTLFILAAGVTAALTASIFHSLVDFVWFIPACASVTVLLAACAMRLAQLAAPTQTRFAERQSLGQLTKFNMALASSLAGIWILATLFPAAQSSLEWDKYVLSDQASQDAKFRRASAFDTADQDITEAEELNAVSSLVHLTNVLRIYPQSARAHVRLAGGLISRFESLQQQSDNPMSIGQIREAATASDFPASQALREWLERAFGENCRLLYQASYHARRALALCPLQGEAYVYLAELSFLEGRDASAVESYSRQGLFVRPWDPDVLFAVGKRYLVDGNIDRALSLWSKAYQGAGKHQYLINRILVGNMTAANFIRVFQPGWTSLGNLWTCYRERGMPDDLNTILPYAILKAQEHAALLPLESTGWVWWELASMQKDMGLESEALENLQLAYAANPDNFRFRYDLGKSLVNFERYELAESHLRWCLGQSPGNESIQAELLQISRLKMQTIARNPSTVIKQTQ